MPTLEIESITTVEVEAGKRLVLAIENAGVDIMHACGGNARCTTCRVEFLEGEPERMTVAERDKLSERQLTGVRLSCQIQCQGDMKLRVVLRLSETGRPDPGATPSEEITPPPEWVRG
jgi:ferredoxin